MKVEVKKIAQDDDTHSSLVDTHFESQEQYEVDNHSKRSIAASGESSTCEESILNKKAVLSSTSSTKLVIEISPLNHLGTTDVCHSNCMGKETAEAGHSPVY